MGRFGRLLAAVASVATGLLVFAGAAFAANAQPVRISELKPASGSTVTAGQDVVVSGFIETESGIGSTNGQPDVAVQIDGVTVTPEVVVGSKAMNVGFQITRQFSAGSHTLSVIARDVAGATAQAESRFTATGASSSTAVRIGDLKPLMGDVVSAGVPMTLSGFVETDEGIGLVGDKPDITVTLDGTPVATEVVVGSKALNASFQATASFLAGTHTMVVTARDFKGQASTAQTTFTADAATCQFANGFAKLQRQISDITGRCLTNEFADRMTGDILQMTTGEFGNGGMFVYRKSDGHVAYTDGYRSWVLGPKGEVLPPRLNTERYGWEKERLTPKMLREGQYHLPIGQNDAEVTFKLVDGKASFPNPLFPAFPNAEVTLGNSSVWYGDFDGDGYRDAVVVLAVALGGSGEDVYAVPVRDVNGQPVQLGHELLGNRIRVNEIALGTGVVSVDMYTQGPNDIASNPTMRVSKAFAVKLP